MAGSVDARRVFDRAVRRGPKRPVLDDIDTRVLQYRKRCHTLWLLHLSVEFFALKKSSDGSLVGVQVSLILN